MDVQTADAKRVDRRSAGQPVGLLGPGRQLLGNVKRRVVPIDLGVERLDANGRHERAMLQAQHVLDDARHAGGLQRMADVGFDAGNGNLLAGRETLAQHLDQGVQLRGIAQIGAGGMRFDVLQRAHFHAVAIGPFHGLDLTFAARSPEAFSASVRRHACAADDGLNPVAVGQGARQCFEHQADIAFGADQPVGIGVEGPRAGFAHGLRMREEHQRIGLAIRGAAGDGHVDVAQLQGADAHHDRLQRGGARRVHTGKRAVEPKGLGDRARDHVDGHVGRVGHALRRLAAHRFDEFVDDRFLFGRGQLGKAGHFAQELRRFFDARAVGEVAGQVAPLGMADENARVAQGQVKRIKPAVAQRLGSGLAHQQVGVVDGAFQLRRDGAGLPVELAAGDDRAQLGVGLAALAAARVVVEFLVEPVGRQLRDGAAAAFEQLPELVQVIRAGQATSHANNGDRNTRVIELRFHALLPLASRVTVARRPANWPSQS